MAMDKANQPKAIRYRAWIFVVSWPMMGISNSKTRPPAESASPANCDVYPRSVCRNCGISTRLLNNKIPRVNIIRFALAKLKLLEHADVDDRRLLKPLPDHQRDQADGRDHDESRNEVRPEPIIFLALVEQDLQRADTQRSARAMPM